MSVRVVARIRPLLQSEIEKDQILSIHHGDEKIPQIVKIPNPKNFSEEYRFNFNSVYGQDSSQQDLFDAEVAPTLKHLFQGFDVTLFAYGVTGTGKTHTMRGGKSMVDRGMIPRMLSNIYRKSKALEKNTNGETVVQVNMSYYEIYNDKVFDLFEPPEKRTPHGLPIREAEGGKTVIAGLSEVPCSNLRDFEVLYDRANSNRSVGATKLNAQSSRSHAILCVKVTVSTPVEERSSTISAIDLAGSEDNRRTGNAKERMVESASINKSLFVLAQCVEAISRKQSRIPYRESKMTRILSLGQNNGLTVMILNLAPTKSYHLDTLSSLNFANRTKKIEIREIENEPTFKGPPRPQSTLALNSHITRQPLRPLTTTNTNILANKDNTKAEPDRQDKPVKLFSVYADKVKSYGTTGKAEIQRCSPMKRKASDTLQSTHPSKQARPMSSTSLLRRGPPPTTTTLTTATLDALVEKKVAEVLAAREAAAVAQAESQPQQADKLTSSEPVISADVQARLDQIERRLESQQGERAEGLSYLFMAKQAQVKGDDKEALAMYERAEPFFPGNQKLERKIEKLRAKLSRKRRSKAEACSNTGENSIGVTSTRGIKEHEEAEVGTEADASYQDQSYDESYHDTASDIDDHSSRSRKKTNRRQHKPKGRRVAQASSPDQRPQQSTQDELQEPLNIPRTAPSPRTRYLLDTLNTCSIDQLKQLPGLGAKRAEAIAEHLNQMEWQLTDWRQVLQLDIKGVGKKSWETMREGITF